jgi:putative heme-binding domain-containing protein
VQPGSKIDYAYPPESPRVEFAASAPATLKLLTPEALASDAQPEAQAPIAFSLPPEAAKIVPVELQLKTPGGAPPTLKVSWSTNEDDRQRPLQLRRQLVPWARPDDAKPDQHPPAAPPELAGGDWQQGSAVFFGPDANCSKCHTVRSHGGTIGPDLSNLMHRDYASVLRDINQPSFAINPDYLSYIAALDDGRTFAGVVKTSGDKVSISDSQGNTTTVDRAAVEELKASPISTMPEGLTKNLSAEQLRDLMTFLLTQPPAQSEAQAP